MLYRYPLERILFRQSVAQRSRAEFERAAHIQDFVDRHSSVVDQANLAVSDGNLPPDGLAQLARLCAMAGVPLVFEPTSVGKSCAPFSSQVRRSSNDSRVIERRSPRSGSRPYKFNRVR